MAQPIVVTYSTGATLAAGAQQVSEAGLGDVWDFNAGDWAASGSFADTTDEMTEDGTSGLYSVVLPTLSDYSGEVIVKIHDDTEAVVFSFSYVSINGEPAQSAISPVVISRARSFQMLESVEGAKAANVVAMQTNKTLTVAFDFTRVLNPRTGISAGTVSVVSGSGVTISNVRVAQDAQALHADVLKSATGNATLRATINTTDVQELSGDAIITAA